jgi:hypothetical protein
MKRGVGKLISIQNPSPNIKKLTPLLDVDYILRADGCSLRSSSAIHSGSWRDRPRSVGGRHLGEVKPKWENGISQLSRDIEFSLLCRSTPAGLPIGPETPKVRIICAGWLLPNWGEPSGGDLSPVASDDRCFGQRCLEASSPPNRSSEGGDYNGGERSYARPVSVQEISTAIGVGCDVERMLGGLSLLEVYCWDLMLLFTQPSNPGESNFSDTIDTPSKSKAKTRKNKNCFSIL